MPKGCIIYCIENGSLELLTLLSIASIRKFGGDLNHFDIFCLQPRKEFPISSKTKAKLDKFGVTFINNPLNKIHRYYALANKPLACEFIVNNYTYDQYLFLDGDTIVVADPTKYLSSANDINLCPVNNKGVGIRDFNDDNTSYWLTLFKETGVDKVRIPIMKTQATKERILSYWNSGVMLFNGKSGIFHEWKVLLFSILSRGTFPEGSMFFAEQTCLSAVLLSGKYSVGTLPVNCNFPILKEKIEGLGDTKPLSIIHHYNNLNQLENQVSRFVGIDEIEWIWNEIDELGVFPKGMASRIIKNGNHFKMKFMEKLYFFIYKFSSN